MNKYQIISSISGGLGAALLTIVQVKNDILSIVTLPLIFFPIILIIGVFLLIASAILFLSNTCINIRGKLFCNSIAYSTCIAKKSDLIYLHQLCDKQIPGVFASISRWYERHQKNNKIIYITKKIKNSPFKSEEEIVGGFSIFPISKNISEYLDTERISGVEFFDDHILNSKEKPYSLYIAWIVANDIKSKAYTLSILRNIVIRHMKTGVKAVYAKPSTNDGLRLIRSYKFMPLNNQKYFELNKVHKLMLEIN